MELKLVINPVRVRTTARFDILMSTPDKRGDRLRAFAVTRACQKSQNAEQH